MRMRSTMAAVVTGLMLVGGGAAYAQTAPAGADPQAPPAGGNPPLTLEEYLGWDEESALADHNRIEQLVADCMIEQGFDYRPFVIAEYPADPLADLTPLEFAQQFGYGFHTMDDLPFDDAFLEDPNEETYNALSLEQKEAWELALYGDVTDVVETESEVEPVESEGDVEPVESEVVEGEVGEFELGGCWGEADRQVYPPVSPELENALIGVFEGVAQDPRYVEGQESWAACVREAGIDVEAFGDAEAYVFELTGDPEDLKAEEIRVAVADVECRAEHFPVELEDEIVAELEAQVVEEHREELESIHAQRQA